MKIRTDHKYLFGKFAEDMIQGGKADEKTPKASPQEKAIGKEVEMEHTNNPEVAKEIARDHHDEDKDYYKKLKIMESDAFDKAFKSVLQKSAGCLSNKKMKATQKKSPLLSKSAAELTTAGRKRIALGNFAVPEKAPGPGSYPIHDIAHGRNALARVAQHGSSELQKKVKAAVYAKFPSLKQEM